MTNILTCLSHLESHSGASDVGISASWNLFSNHTKKESLKSVENSRQRMSECGGRWKRGAPGLGTLWLLMGQRGALNRNSTTWRLLWTPLPPSTTSLTPWSAGISLKESIKMRINSVVNPKNFHTNLTPSDRSESSHHQQTRPKPEIPWGFLNNDLFYATGFNNSCSF